ncbi:MAG: helix-turn-helix domain-containing protein [Bacteroidota bacterium]
MAKCKIKDILLYEGGKDQQELAAAADLSPNTVSKFANDKEISDKSIARILDGLNKIATRQKYSLEDLYTFKKPT